MKRKSKWIWSGIFLSIFLIILIAFFFHEAILFHAGKFMAPEGDYEADVAIKIFPTACFNEYELDQWWERYPGVRDFGTEVLKLAYYMVGGYIPLKFSY
jgi:hypothetical protein